MQTHDVPSNQWSSFLNSFTQLHRGERVDVESVGGGTAPRSLLCDQPLLGVVAVPDCGQGACIEVIAGSEETPQTETIRRPAHLSVTELEDGRPVELQIAADDGSVTALRFEPEPRSDKPPEVFLG